MDRACADGPVSLPEPVLVFIGPEYFEAGGKEWTRYRYTVTNLADYSNELFAMSPDLPPCGDNPKAARTWVNVTNKKGKKLNEFCALKKNDDLNGLWFSLERNVIPPSYVFVELTDRKTDVKIKSNLADTTE
ncbi:MAG: hypothetical protein H7062_04095 [Candidatus Saccharimonas sp.]|nr:hypothetical protein [Planctomycetaceae bacterium]